MHTMTDVVIVGGGVIGCSIAYYLRKQQIDVILLERGELASQASGAAAGLLAPLGPLSGVGPFADLVLNGFSALTTLVGELEEDSGITVGYEQTGALRVVLNPKRVTHLRKRMQNWHALGLPLYWLDGDEARQQEPLLSPNVQAAVYAPEESQISASRLVQAFASAARRLGAHIYEHIGLSSFLTHNSSVTGVRVTTGETISCRHVILATGAWTPRYTSELGVELPIHPLSGQLMTLPHPTSRLTHIVFGNAGYLVPHEHEVLVGATKEERGFDSTVTEEATSWLHSTATQLVPAFTHTRVQRTWAGLRPKTPDGWPILDVLTPWQNVIVAAGHNSVGIILSALTGQSVAELVVTGRMPSVVQPFSLRRFEKNEVIF